MGGQAIPPETVSGLVTIETTEFRRGDANGDGVVDVSDGAFLSRWLFGIGPSGTCDDVGDTNDDGVLQGAVDTIFLLSFLFQNGPAVPQPQIGCGFDPTADPLLCESYPLCP